MTRGSRLARLVAVTVGVSLKNPTFLIPLDYTNSESSETVSSTKSSTISSAIPLMTISTIHAKDKLSLSLKWNTHPIIFAQDIGLSQNSKRTRARYSITGLTTQTRRCCPRPDSRRPL
ncbi:hypothetical protein EDB89DRAFT_2014109, partial [Lactarius sanguifluus]